MVLPNGQPKTHEELCPFLEMKAGLANCTVHGQTFKLKAFGRTLTIKWKNTPCGQHGQIEHRNTECRMGRYILDNGGLQHEFDRMKDDQGQA